MGVNAARVVFPESDRAEIATAISGLLATGALTLGPHTERFEDAFAAAISAGARPVFADIDPATFALSPQTLEAALTPDTAAVLLVHIAWLITPGADELRRICDDRGIVLIEDAAHAHGATYRGRHAGTFGSAAAFSFYPTKVVTSGEGGMIVTSDPAIAEEARVYRDQGKGSSGANHHVRQGYAWRMSELGAAAGDVHLRRMAQLNWSPTTSLPEGIRRYLTWLENAGGRP